MKNGIICLTFDDCDVNGWCGAIPLFEKYGARCTFSFSGEITSEMIACMKELEKAGHSIGLHSIHHADAPEYIAALGAEAYFKNEVQPQLAAVRGAGVRPGTFAFPNNKYDDISLNLLKPYFHHFRGGYATIDEECYLPLDMLKQSPVLRGLGLGAYYSRTDVDSIAAWLDRAAAENKCLTFFTHAIASAAVSVNIDPVFLEEILDRAASNGSALLGFDDVNKL